MEQTRKVMLKRLIIPTGKRFGRLTIIKELDRIEGYQNKKLVRNFLCKCDCGNTKNVMIAQLRNGSISSCGCLLHETRIQNGKNKKKHGHTKTDKFGKTLISPTYSSWLSMRARCNSKNHMAYHRYGGRGIKIDDRWNIFINFLNDMGERPYKMTLDRIDNNGNYELSNCRWISIIDQMNNTSSNRIVEFNKTKYTIAQLARKLNINYQTLKSRIDNGYTEYELSKPVRYKKK